MTQFEISKLALASLQRKRIEDMQNADITREIATVTRDYKYALDKLVEGNSRGADDPNLCDTAFNLTQLAQQERRKRPFWRRIF